jgi:hypothetical protein
MESMSQSGEVGDMEPLWTARMEKTPGALHKTHGVSFLIVWPAR